MDLEKIETGKFLDDLASSLPAPGGGSAAGFCAAIASALVSMVSNLTLNKEKYKENWPMMDEIRQKSETMRKVFIKLMNDDIASFNFYMTTLKMPKSTEVEKTSRRKAMQDALKFSTDVPLQMIDACSRLEELAFNAALHGNPNLISDAGAAALIAEAAAKAASYNIQMNLPNVTDIEEAGRYQIHMKDALASVITKASEVSKLMEKVFTKCNRKE
jgi:formiminotetrahydrofolate cyclodeaminase